ncbi:MAG: hypothetical protein SFV55_14515 [Haliscomenobacter sp.]|uniref:hypothetical protein n=1 Tax=Haliscomenobacter sp. TaxID=2717303 RepID=UPI0029BAF833|nr:hypothetical protein [Haliscomenobacter sp.]MDX2069638.1 hypothetical protein [Haliscomenobacter sp.]
MIEKIKEEPLLSRLLRDECEENEVCVTFDESIPKENYVILNIDEHYRSIQLNRPPTPDCLIVQQCEDGTYSLFVIELKKAAKPRGFKVDKLVAKFETCLNDFMANEFKDIFDQKFKRVQLFFVSNIDPQTNKSLILKGLISRSINFQGANRPIVPKMPNYKIEKC